MKKLLFVLLMIPIFCQGQDVMTENLQANKTIEGALDEMLRIVNGEKGKTRNWPAFKLLFLPTVKFTVVHDDENPHESATLDEMIAYMQDDYYNNETSYQEKLISRKIDTYNGIAQVFEAVEHIEPDGTKIKGLNSYHLIKVKGNWKIANIIWTTEADGEKIPEKYLKN